MKMIDITSILDPELKFRTSARDFAKYLSNMGIDHAQVDFSRVRSVTRSFMDEFYHLLVREDNAQGVQIAISGMSTQADEFLKSVRVIADAPRKVVTPSNARFFNPVTPQQLSEYIAGL